MLNLCNSFYNFRDIARSCTAISFKLSRAIRLCDFNARYLRDEINPPILATEFTISDGPETDILLSFDNLGNSRVLSFSQFRGAQ